MHILRKPSLSKPTQKRIRVCENAIITPTKTLPKKYDYSPIIFQITLSTYKLDSFLKKKKTYKLDSQNKNTGFYFC